MKRHLDQVGFPLCGASSAGALVVERRQHATCQRCIRAWARRILDAATVVLRATR